MRGSSISTSLGKVVSELRRNPSPDLARVFDMKRKKGGSQGGEVEVPFSGGYDAQQAECAPEELVQISQEQIFKHKVMSEDAGEVGIARGPFRLEDTDEEEVCDSERSITRFLKREWAHAPSLNTPTYEIPVQMSCEDDLRPASPFSSSQSGSDIKFSTVNIS